MFPDVPCQHQLHFDTLSYFWPYLAQSIAGKFSFKQHFWIRLELLHAQRSQNKARSDHLTGYTFCFPSHGHELPRTSAYQNLLQDVPQSRHHRLPVFLNYRKHSELPLPSASPKQQCYKRNHLATGS